MDWTEKLKKETASTPERLTMADDRELPHYCADGDCWCSEKLPGKDHPLTCKAIGCGHHQGATL